MGLLDEAIREHLELKRRRGADPGDVAREEQEALGPPVRAPVAAPPEPEATEVDAADGAPAEEPALDVPPAPDEVAVEPHPVTEHQVVEPPAGEEPTRIEPAPAEPPPAEPEAAAPAESDTAPVAPEQAGGETVGFDAEELFADEDAQVEEPGPQPGEAEGEDVLEETPEFLQETPEHDRLWFEQKPPRDFDFDG
jgi:hypothetical protein